MLCFCILSLSYKNLFSHHLALLITSAESWRTSTIISQACARLYWDTRPEDLARHCNTFLIDWDSDFAFCEINICFFSSYMPTYLGPESRLSKGFHCTQVSFGFPAMWMSSGAANTCRWDSQTYSNRTGSWIRKNRKSRPPFSEGGLAHNLSYVTRGAYLTFE